MAPPQPSLAQDLPQEPNQDLPSCMHSLRGGVGSNIWLYEPGTILSLQLARSALKIPYRVHARSYKAVSAIGTTIASDRSSSNPILDLSLLNFQTPTTTAVDTIQYPLSFTALFPPASTPFCDSSFPNSVSQNGIPNGIPLLVHNALCPRDTYVSRNETHKVIVYCTFCIHQLRGFFSIGFSSRSTRFSK